MSLFTGEPIDLPIKIDKVVLSASRMTDMPKFYPEELIREVDKRINKGMKIHTLVLWTKHPQALMVDPLYGYLLGLREKGIQLYLHLTITGMGGLNVGVKANNEPLVLERNSPNCEDALSTLPQVINLVQRPERIRLRIDPIIRMIDAKGDQFSSLKFLPIIIKTAASYGIKYFSFSFLERDMHRKVDKRFAELGCKIYSPTIEEREKVAKWLQSIAAEYNVFIQACCISGFPEMRCIDGYLLQELHDDKAPTDKNEPRKRAKCACTASIDIGGWPPKKCFTGCDYCYANCNYYD